MTSGFDFTGKAVLVTGGSRGLGAAMCRAYAKHGADIVISSRKQDNCELLAQEIEKETGRRPLPFAAHAGQWSDLERLADAAYRHFGRVDILINNAGIASVGNVEACTPEELDRIYQVNVKGMYHCLHFAIPAMVQAGGGCVVNLASVASYLGISERFAYSMSKGAVLSMTMSIARDYIDSGIRCNCICPGRVHTPFVDGYLAKNYSEEERPEMFRKLSEWQPIGRMGTPGEIAGLVAYLTSEQASFITGSAFEIDGGVTNLR